MNHRHWNILVLGSSLVLLIAMVIANYENNSYGVFGDVTGKDYVVYDNERTTKYLFSYNYIPHNFDSLLVGTSVSDNWDTGTLTGMRMYNASINGANITEEALVVDKVLERRCPRLALFVIYPWLTETHGRRSGYMYPQEYWGALGSIQLFRAYARRWLIDRGYEPRRFNAFGRFDFDNSHAVQPYIKQLFSQQLAAFYIDSQALREYGDLLNHVRGCGAKVIGVIPPVEMDLWELDRGAFASYNSAIMALFRQNEAIVDLNGPAFDQFRSVKTNFQDGVHLTRSAADQIVGALASNLGLVSDRLDREVTRSQWFAYEQRSLACPDCIAANRRCSGGCRLAEQ